MHLVRESIFGRIVSAVLVKTLYVNILSQVKGRAEVGGGGRCQLGGKGGVRRCCGME